MSWARHENNLVACWLCFVGYDENTTALHHRDCPNNPDRLYHQAGGATP